MTSETSAQQPTKPTAPSTEYEKWMADQDIPIVYTYGVHNVRDVERAFWDGPGHRAAFVQLYGMEGFTGMFVGEIEAGGETKPQKHLYEELIQVFDGHGEVEIWLPGASASEREVVQFEPYSLFAIPLNCWYAMRNTGSEPVIFASVNNAPLVMDLFHDRDFVLQNDYAFTSRYSPASGFDTEGERLLAQSGVLALRTNIIESVRDLAIDPDERRGRGTRITVFEMAGNTLAGHLAEWLPRTRQKAHYHAPGAVLLIARSEGYTLMWPSQAGIRPYESGNEDQVVRVEWREGSAFCPPDQWFHQHFNTGAESAKQVAIRYGSTDHPAGFAAGFRTQETRDIVPTRTSIRHGGTAIEFDDEDPRILADYQAIVGDLS